MLLSVLADAVVVVVVVAAKCSILRMKHNDALADRRDTVQTLPASIKRRHEKMQHHQC